MNKHTTFPTDAVSSDEAIRRIALENEFARRRKLNNIPDLHLTPDWLELAIAKDWSLVNGEPSEVRARAEAEARKSLDLAKLSKAHRIYRRSGL